MAEWLKTLRRFVALACALGIGHTPSLHAQDANNVLGLPAVPQRPAAPASKAASASTKPAVAAKPSDAQIKAVLSGKITAVSTYQDGLMTVRITTERTFISNAERAQGLQAAKLIQRDVRLACGNLCKPAPMPTPALQPDNTLAFDIVVEGYEGSMSTPNIINLVSGKRVSAATQAAPTATAPTAGAAVAIPVVPPASASAGTSP